MSKDTAKSILNSNGRFPGHKLSLKEKKQKLYHYTSFETFVKIGDRVEEGTPLCKVDDWLLNGKEPLYTPVLLTNADEMSEVKFHTGKVKSGKDWIITYRK